MNHKEKQHGHSEETGGEESGGEEAGREEAGGEEAGREEEVSWQCAAGCKAKGLAAQRSMSAARCDERPDAPSGMFGSREGGYAARACIASPPRRPWQQRPSSTTRGTPPRVPARRMHR